MDYCSPRWITASTAAPRRRRGDGDEDGDEGQAVIRKGGGQGRLLVSEGGGACGC